MIRKRIRSKKISGYFTDVEALWLPQWNRIADEQDGLNSLILDKIVKFAQIMDKIRELLGKPIIVSSWYRPPAYNKLVGGARFSQHMSGQACDFQAKGLTCDQVRSILLPHLEELDIRMENNPGSDWVHVDSREPGPGGRYFKP